MPEAVSLQHPCPEEPVLGTSLSFLANSGSKMVQILAMGITEVSPVPVCPGSCSQPPVGSAGGQRVFGGEVCIGWEAGPQFATRHISPGSSRGRQDSDEFLNVKGDPEGVGQPGQPRGHTVPMPR